MVDGSWRSVGRDLPSRHEGEALLLGIGTDEIGGGGGEKLGVECHDVVGVQLLSVSVLLLRALSYMYAVSRMAVRPTGLPSLRFPSFVR